MSIGTTVRYLRAERNLSQKELAEKAGVTQATISRLESGRVKELKSDTLRLLADTLSVTADHLMQPLTVVENSGDVLKFDHNARFLVQGYKDLSAEGRDQLMKFVRFLVSDEKGDEIVDE